MIKLILASLYAVNPPAYYFLKRAAIARHQVFNKYLEGGTGELEGTWHEKAFDYLYPY